MEPNTPLNNRPLLGSTSRSTSTTPGVQGSFIDYRLKVKGLAGASNAAGARQGAGRSSTSNMPTILADKLAQKRTESGTSQTLEGSADSPKVSPIMTRPSSASSPPPRQIIQQPVNKPIQFEASRTFIPARPVGTDSASVDDDQVLAGSESSSVDSEPRSVTPTPSPLRAAAQTPPVVNEAPPRSDSAQLDALMEMINNAGAPAVDFPTSTVAAPAVAPQPAPRAAVRPITMGDFMDDPRLDSIATKDEDFISALEMSDSERAEFLETLLTLRPKKEQSPAAPLIENDSDQSDEVDENSIVSPRNRLAPPSQPHISLPDTLRAVAASPANVSSSSLKTTIEEVTEDMMDSLPTRSRSLESTT
eukprot:TRINITY_DN8908_c0_g1_i1.p1 TRINITY_DN8908_c0_g1~~TRINITY_DN8908_c0_g1_i1.p1  ORF type:complete len:362 (+),score=53.44 TRINITY_DN8908_c0_g1_i1:69-1154(+)